MSSENNINLLFFTSENIVFFHKWKYHVYSFQMYIDVTAKYKIIPEKSCTQC